MWTHWDILHCYSCLFANNNKSHTWFFFLVVLFSNKSFTFFYLCWFIINWYLNNTHLFNPNKSNLTMDHILFFIVNFHTRGVFGLHWDGKKKLLKNGGFYGTVYALLILFMDFTALFCTIHEPHYIISTNFYLYLQYFQ